MLKNSKVVLFLSPYKVGQAGNFWTLLRTVNSFPLPRPIGKTPSREVIAVYCEDYSKCGNLLVRTSCCLLPYVSITVLFFVCDILYFLSIKPGLWDNEVIAFVTPITSLRQWHILWRQWCCLWNTLYSLGLRYELCDKCAYAFFFTSVLPYCNNTL